MCGQSPCSFHVLFIFLLICKTCLSFNNDSIVHFAQLLSVTDNVDIIDDVLEYIAALGDAAKDQTSLESPLSVTPDDKAIVDTTVHDVLAILPEKILPEVLFFEKWQVLLTL